MWNRNVVQRGNVPTFTQILNVDNTMLMNVDVDSIADEQGK